MHVCVCTCIYTQEQDTGKFSIQPGDHSPHQKFDAWLFSQILLTFLVHSCSKGCHFFYFRMKEKFIRRILHLCKVIINDFQCILCFFQFSGVLSLAARLYSTVVDSATFEVQVSKMISCLFFFFF